MNFTGERFVPTEQGKIRLEHYHRYAAIRDVIAGKTVLDVACGEGYGSRFMSDVATSVTGVDISSEAVVHASTAYIRNNLSFRQGSATALDFPDESFDVVVSFETIEHLLEQAKMLAEIRRVLRTNGFLIISSPNRPIYSQESGEYNEYHVKELDFDEFDELLKIEFKNVQYFGQRMQMGSVIQPINGEFDSIRVWHDDGVELNLTSGQLIDPVYFLAICGSLNSNLPRLDMSFLYPDKSDLIKHYIGFAKWARSQDIAVAERDTHVSRLSNQLIELQAKFDVSTKWALQLDAKREQLERQQLLLTQSWSWRLSSPLRMLGRLLRGEWGTIRTMISPYAIRWAKYTYRRLPLSRSFKDRLVSLVYKSMCPLFDGVVDY